MLPYSNAGIYGGSAYGRRKGFFGSPNNLAGVLALVAIAALGFSVFTHFRASSANAQKNAIKDELETLRSELYSVRSQFSSRNSELEQLQLTHGHTQRRIMELNNQLQRKEAEVRGASGKEAELTKMVEDLRSELLRSDGVIEALDAKMAKMEATHASREKDWHILANKWIKYEEEMHDQYKKCSEEVSKLRNQTLALNDTAPLPEAEPVLRPETDFGQIHTEIPAHKPHHFEPLPPPTPTPAPINPADLSLPDNNIRESIAHMTGGQLGQEQAPAGGAPADVGPAGSGQPHQAPEPTQVHHHDVYHHDFHDDTAHLHNYDHYHGHYESYDPMDEWWLHDGHGDWNADDQGHGHVTGDDVKYHDQNYHGQGHHHHDQHHHDQHHHGQHHNQNDLHDQQHGHRLQEVHNGGWGGHPHPSPSGDETHHYQHHQPQAMQGMEQHAQHEQHAQYAQHAQHEQQAQHGQHAQHAPSHWQQHDSHQQQQQQQQYHQQQHQEHHQQQYGDAHQQHPRGDLAYKMGW
ncbi:hypothetical protein Vafri_4517 [Volvox africanus]|uniref:Uncharacterized protein n=1 Tax=Volvox africanus TaxID=51714 RepID=A0A8J4AUC6_9CHLO|nr:hypothetical protein Vafri_4517 [Volvox africanus]